MKKVALIFLIILLSFSSSPCLAASQVIDNGISFLNSSQAIDGRWVSNTIDDFYTTSEVLNSLLYLNMTGNEYTGGVNWVASQSEEDIDFLTQRLLFLNSSNDLETLLSYRNQNGGWGTYPGFIVSSDIDTVRALQALKTANYSDQAVISSIIDFLKMNQNSDGGWGLKQGMDSEVFYTTKILNTLVKYKTTYNLQTQINSAVAFLLSKKNPDGGFGQDVVTGEANSTTHETAMALIALFNGNTGQAQDLPLQEAIQNGIAYLTATQQANGSWNDDPYSTALALRALANVKPNLSISSNDITFSKLNPTIGDTITITANIHNTGPAQADSISVKFFDNDPNSGGILIGEATITSISPYSNSSASITYTLTTASAKTIYVSIDPLNTIDELNEADNIAFKNLTISTLPDLSITSADITISPSAPATNTDFSISAMIRNNGESSADNVTVAFYDNDPNAGGTFIGNSFISSIAPGSMAYILQTANLSKGTHNIYVLADSANTVHESDETNNTAIKTVSIGLGFTDLSIRDADITFTPEYPVEGNTVTINAFVHNTGENSINNAVVRFYLGNPLAGGTI